MLLNLYLFRRLFVCWSLVWARCVCGAEVFVEIVAWWVFASVVVAGTVVSFGGRGVENLVASLHMVVLVYWFAVSMVVIPLSGTGMG